MFGDCGSYFCREIRVWTQRVAERALDGEPAAFLRELQTWNRWPDACVDWPYARLYSDITGEPTYGQYVVDGVHYRPHVEMLRWYAGEPPDDLRIWALHHCKNNMACINPTHLYWGTPTNNADDRYADTGNPSGRPIDVGVQIRNGQIRDRVRNGELQKDLAAEFGLSVSLVSLIINGKR